MASLIIRNLFFTLLLPGFVAGLAPYWILEGENAVGSFPPPFHFLQVPGILIFIPGITILISCIARFAFEGRGTLAPVDPTRKLVVGGLYRYSRNPMYIGVISILTGESLYFRSLDLGLYSLFVFLGFNLFIMIVEEPRLRRDFGKQYEEYCKKVGRWL